MSVELANNLLNTFGLTSASMDYALTSKTIAVCGSTLWIPIFNTIRPTTLWCYLLNSENSMKTLWPMVVHG